MTKKSLFTVLILLITVFAVALTACSSVTVVSLSIDESSEFKTRYLVGDEVDLNGITLVVTRSDETSYTVNATDVRADLKVTGFDTSSPKESLSVILVYKGLSTTYQISVVSKDDDTQKCKVTFDTGKGSVIEDEYVSAYSALVAPEDPVMDGYAFDGWYKENTYNNVWNFNTDKVVDDTVLYAKWAKLYTVTFVDEINGVADIVRYVKEGATLTDIPTLPTREGEYGEWDRKVFTDIHTDIVVHSVYTPMTYTVRFVYIGSDGKTQVEVGVFNNVSHGEDLSVTQTDRIQEIEDNSVPQYNSDGNKHFTGWDIDFNHIVSDLTVTAVYEVNKYSVTFDVNYECEDKTYQIASDISHGNAVLAPDAPQRVGYVFDGWYKQEECVGAWDFTADRISADVTLYAKWTKLVSVRYLIPQDVTVDDEASLNMETLRLTENGVQVTYKLYYVSEIRTGGNAEKPSVPSRRGYRGSWGIDDVNLVNVQNDINVKIVYDIITDYKVRFYDYDRTLLSEQDVTFEQGATAPTQNPSRTGYVFKGWDKDYSSIDSDLDVTAVYEAGVYKVKYYPNNGAVEQTIDVACDSRINIRDLTYTDYAFKGWYTDTSFGEAFDTSVSLLAPEYTVGKKEGDVVLVLYAKWVRIYKVYFYNESGAQVYVESVEDGTLVQDVPEIAEKIGYTSSWCQKNSEGAFAATSFDFKKPINEVIRLYPKYVIKRYVVRFYVETSIHTELTVEHGKTIESTITDPDVEGKLFKGWDKPAYATLILDDTDFTAILETLEYTVTWGADSGITSVVEYGNAATFPITATLPVKRGYTLTSWRVSSPADGNMSSVKTDLVLEPVFTVNNYSVVFKDRDTNAVYPTNEGNLTTSVQYDKPVVFLSNDTIIDNPQKQGYGFAGWQAGNVKIGYSEATSRWYLGGTSTSAQGTSVAEGYLVVADGNYYFIAASESSVSSIFNSSNWENRDIVKPITYANDKWNYNGTDISALNLAFTKGVYFCVRDDVTFLAMFDVSYYTVKYNTNATGITVDPQTLRYGAFVTAPSVPDRDGYVFLGWYADSAFTARYDFEGTALTSDIMLYAKWEVRRDSTQGLEYTLTADGSAYALTGSNDLTEKDVIVANYYNGKPVTAIGVGAFAGRTSVESIDLPNTLETIGPKAFMGCTSLKSITIPEGVKIIPDNAFNGCTALETVSFAANPAVTTIGKSAFAGATALKYSTNDSSAQVAFTLPSSLVTIEDGAFQNALGIRSLTIPSSVVTIGDRAFAGADNLRYVKFERNNPCNLGSDAFLNTTALAKAFRIYVPNTVSYQANSAGESWNKLSQAIASSSLITLDGQWAYAVTGTGAELVQYLGDNTEVDIPESIAIYGNANYKVGSLGNYVFDNTVTAVKTVSTNSISLNTFGSAQNLTCIKIEIRDNGIGYAINADYLRNAYDQCENLDTLQLISPVMTLTDIFGGVTPTSLTKVALEGDVAADLLANCAYIKTVTIKDAAAIGESAFVNCTALETVVFADGSVSVLSIGASAFNGCLSLGENGFKVGTANGLPATINSIGENAFEGTAWLDGNTESMVIIGDGILYKYQGSDSVVNIPATVKGITAYAFSGNQNITRVVVLDPNNSQMNTIGKEAFSNCVKLESVIIPAGVKSIGEKAFYGCSKLATVALFNGTGNGTNIGSSAFDGVSSNVHYYAKAATGTDAYTNYNAGTRKGKVMSVSGMDVEIGASEDEKWLYAESSKNSSQAVLIKYIGNSDTVEVPIEVNNKNVAEIADYAFTRSMTSLAFRASIEGYKGATGAFAGVTELQSLSIYNYDETYGQMTPSVLGNLITANTKLTSVNLTSARAISDLIGGVLPSNIKTVNILPDEQSIADNFLKDCASVENVYVTVGAEVKEVKALEDTIGIAAHNFTQIGAKAFAGTAWLEAYDNDYIIVLGGNLIDYKGKNAILDIPSDVTVINAGVFKGDQFIEIVTIPSSVTSIGSQAFYNATNLTKVFIEAAATVADTNVISTVNDCFNTSSIGREIFVPTAKYDAYTAEGSVWKNFGVKKDEGIQSFDYIESEYITGTKRMEVHGQYIINTDGTLLLARRYNAVYSGSTLLSIDEIRSITVGDEITDKNSGQNYAVYALGNNVFMSGVERVTIDLGFEITDNTFTNIKDLKQLVLTNIDLGNRGFEGAALRNIIIKKKVKSLAYDGSVTLDALLNVSTDALRETVKEHLKEIEIYSGVTHTVGGMLKGYTFIESVKYPDGMLSIGVDSFEQTSWYINYEGDFVILGGVLYKYKGNDATINIPASVYVVNDEAFVGSSRLSRVRFATGSKAHTIRNNAFDGCSLLGSITLPDTMVYIAADAFDNTSFSYVDDALLLKGDSDDTTLVKYIGTDTDYTIPVAVTTISANAFAGNTALKNLNYAVGSRLSKIHESAFEGCTALESVNLPATISYIGRSAFHKTKWLAKAINKDENNIEDVIIQGVYYQKLTSERVFTVTSSIKSVTDGAFDDITSFTIEGTQYSRIGVFVTSVVVEDNAHLPETELYNILKDSNVTAFCSSGSLPISSLIGTDEVLTNIIELSFNATAVAICDGYADGWTTVTSVVGDMVSIKSIGESAFRGTEWFENLTDDKYVFAGESGILIKYNGTDDATPKIGGNSPVSGIAPDVFRGNTVITSISFNDMSTITEIPARAFMGCTNLETIELPKSVSIYGEDAFAGTAWIEATVGDYVIIDGKLIAYLGEGGEITIPESVTKIYSYVFAGNESITGVTFSKYNLMREIEANTFAGCVNIESVTLSENIEAVDRTAFEGTAWEATTSSVTKYLYYTDTYNGIKKIVLYLGSDTEVRIPADVTEISPYAFRGVTTLRTLVIPDNTMLKSIPAYAFKDCSSLRSVTIASAVGTIGEGAFDGTAWLSAAKDAFVTVNGRLVDYNGTATTVTVPDGVTTVGAEAFRGNTAITSVVLPDSVTAIEAGAFAGCTALSSITIGENVANIGIGAFVGTTWLSAQTSEFVTINGTVIAYNGTQTEVSLPDSVKTILPDAFAGNTSLTSLTVNGDVTVVDNAFSGCSSLTTVDGTEYFVKVGLGAFDGTPYGDSLLAGGYLVVNGKLIAYNGDDQAIVIPADVTEVVRGVFEGRADITSVSFADVEGAVKVEAYAFANCVNLAEVTLSEKIESVGARAFYNTSWLRTGNKELIMTEGGKILAYVAEGTAVAIPASATKIAEGVFRGNKRIQTLSFANGVPIDIPDYAFEDCTALTSVVFPTTAFEIGEGAFKGTPWLTNESNKSAAKGYVVVRGKLIAYMGTATEITIPANVTFLYDYVFKGNTSITKLSFANGSQLTAVTGEAFKDCTALATVEFRNNMDCIEMSAFDGTPWSTSEREKGDFIVVGNKLLAYVGAGGDIEIPTSVNSFGKNVFKGNTSITRISFAVGSYVSVIPAGTFDGCTNLTEVVLPPEIEDIGKDAFKDTPWLASVIAGNDINGGSVVNGAYVLNGKALMYIGEETTTFTMPEGVTYVGASFFSSASITGLKLTGTEVCTVSFASGALSTITDIWVPENMVDEYRNSAAWQTYAYRIKAIQG